MRRELAAALLGAGAAALAYAGYRVGAAYEPGDPLRGLGRFAETVRAGMAERERDLRDALGLDLDPPQRRVIGDGRAGQRHTGAVVASDPLTVEQALELLRDPAGPRPGGDVDAGAGI